MGIEGAIQVSIKKIKTKLNADVCTTRMPQGKMLRLMVADGVDIDERKRDIPIHGTIAGEAYTTRKIINISDIRQDSRYDPSPSYIREDGPTAMLAVPLLVEGEVYGVVQIYRKDAFDDEQIDLVDTLAQIAAPAYYLIQTSKLNRQAILDIFVAILKCTSLDEIFMLSVDKIADRLGIRSCLIYQVFPKDGEQWCKITAGVPDGEHQIGLLDPLIKHPDIELAAKEKELTVRDLLTDEKTVHLRELAERKGIKKGMYCPLVMNGQNKEKGEVIGVLVAEVRGDDDKDNFSAEEKSFFFDVSQMIAELISHDKLTFQEVRDKIINPSSSAGGFAKLLFKEMAWLQETIESYCKNNQENCHGAKEMCKSAEQLRSYTKRIYTDIGTMQQSLPEVKQIHP